MVFEVGKYYRHNTGLDLAVRDKITTTLFGETLVAETNDPSEPLMPIGAGVYNAENFYEISEQQWMENFEED